MGSTTVIATATPGLIVLLVSWAVTPAALAMVLLRWRWRPSLEAQREPEHPKVTDAAATSQIDRVSRSQLASARASRNAGATRQSANPCARLPSGTLDSLCRYVDFRQRLELAVAELERKLSVLPLDRWRIEPYPLTGERRNTLLVLGEAGVFVISVTYPPGHWDDLVTVHKLARPMRKESGSRRGCSAGIACSNGFSCPVAATA